VTVKQVERGRWEGKIKGRVVLVLKREWDPGRGHRFTFHEPGGFGVTELDEDQARVAVALLTAALSS
jgi:hypothetical protein